jgi:GH15 family glucan-1,4-alpha-glucosidase
VRIRTDVPLKGENMHTEGHFTVRKGDRVPFVMSWHMSYLPELIPRKADHMLAKTRRYWRRWLGDCVDGLGELREPVARSLITLKALTNMLSGGIVAAVTTSLPEWPGSSRNWDYRYCWVRDAAFTLNAFMRWGHTQEIADWRNWLLRACAGKPEDLQIMYGIGGERRLTELELPWLKGFRDSQPVRIGNAASEQRQLDVYGELADALSLGGRLGLPPTKESWIMGSTIINFLETIWQQPDSGLWEMRGPPQHHTYSKVMAWVAFDRAIKAAQSRSLEAPLERWIATRDRIHADVCEKAFDKDLNTFVQAYGSRKLDASLLRIPLVGFLPCDDPRVVATVEAVERDLVQDGMVMRYRTDDSDSDSDSDSGDGLPPGEGAFLACTFWLADALICIGRVDDGRAIFKRLLGIRNDLGLLAEEYDPVGKYQLGNFPQAFSHVGLLHTARNLVDSAHMGPLPR